MKLELNKYNFLYWFLIFLVSHPGTTIGSFNSNPKMIKKQQTQDPSSNVSIGREKNTSLPQKPSLEMVQSREDTNEHYQAPHKLPKGLNQFGNGEYGNINPYNSNPSYERKENIKH